MAPKLYMTDASPAVRSVLLTEKALGIKLEHVEIDLAKGDNRTAEYLKLNPQHTVPTLDDGGKIIWDSHAINIYLITKYGKDDSLYPKDPYKRAVVDQRLHFDTGVLFANGRQIMKAILHDGAKSAPPNLVASVVEGYEFLEKFLEGNKWAAGDTVTVADFSLIPTVTSASVVVPINPSRFPNITAWLDRARKLPYYDANREGFEKLKHFVLGKMQS